MNETQFDKIAKIILSGGERAIYWNEITDQYERGKYLYRVACENGFVITARDIKETLVKDYEHQMNQAAYEQHQQKIAEIKQQIELLQADIARREARAEKAHWGHVGDLNRLQSDLGIILSYTKEL